MRGGQPQAPDRESASMRVREKNNPCNSKHPRSTQGDIVETDTQSTSAHTHHTPSPLTLLKRALAAWPPQPLAPHHPRAVRRVVAAAVRQRHRAGGGQRFQGTILSQWRVGAQRGLRGSSSPPRARHQRQHRRACGGQRVQCRVLAGGRGRADASLPPLPRGRRLSGEEGGHGGGRGGLGRWRRVSSRRRRRRPSLAPRTRRLGRGIVARAVGLAQASGGGGGGGRSGVGAASGRARAVGVARRVEHW